MEHAAQDAGALATVSTGQLEGSPHAAAPAALYKPPLQFEQPTLLRTMLALRYVPAGQGAGGRTAQSKPAGQRLHEGAPGLENWLLPQRAQAVALAPAAAL